MLAYVLIVLMNPSLVYANPIESDYAVSREWLSIMQYKKTVFGTYESRVKQQSEFFISPGGATDPVSELQSSLNAFVHPESYLRTRKRGHPQCLFPARFRLLQQKFNLNVPLVACPNLKIWRETLSADDISVVYAAQYLANPASVMGHTFVRFINPFLESYLSISAGYAADIPAETGALDYVRKGIFGGFDGAFSEFPFYHKIHEYSIMESRDVWEYVLNLDVDQKTRFVLYVWELVSNAKIDYDFLNGNCSSEILAILQFVFPEKRLVGNARAYLTPIESIKIIKENNLIKSEKFRPSLRSQFDAKYASLTTEQSGVVNDAIDTERSPKTKDKVVLDTLLDYVSMQRQENGNYLDASGAQFENDTLIARAAVSSTSTLVEVERPPSPLDAHDSHAIEVSGGSDTAKDSFTSVSIRPGVHQFMDNDAGFLKNSSFNFFQLTIESQAQKTNLSRFMLLDVRNQPRFDSINKDYAWGLAVGYERGKSLMCNECRMFQVAPEIGISLDAFRFWQIAMLALVDLRFSSEFDNGHEEWLGGRIENIFRFGPKTKALLRIDHKTKFSEDDPVSVRSESLEIRRDEVLKNFSVGLETLRESQIASELKFLSSSIKAIIAF